MQCICCRFDFISLPLEQKLSNFACHFYLWKDLAWIDIGVLSPGTVGAEGWRIWWERGRKKRISLKKPSHLSFWVCAGQMIGLLCEHGCQTTLFLFCVWKTNTFAPEVSRLSPAVPGGLAVDLAKHVSILHLTLQLLFFMSAWGHIQRPPSNSYLQEGSPFWVFSS